MAWAVRVGLSRRFSRRLDHYIILGIFAVQIAFTQVAFLNVYLIILYETLDGPASCYILQRRCYITLLVNLK